MASQTALHDLAGIELFRGLGREDVSALLAHMRLATIARGVALVRQGEAADALYIVVSGRFAVRREGLDERLAVIGPGEPVGEIAFFAGGQRTASVIAERDSVVGLLTLQDFEATCARLPSLARAFTRVLAGRLAATTAGRPRPSSGFPRTLAIARAGQHQAMSRLRHMLTEFAACDPRFLLVDAAEASRMVYGDPSFDSCDATQRLNDLEARGRILVFLCDDEPTAWTQKALRQADCVLLVADAAVTCAADALPGPVEVIAAELHSSGGIRLVMMHPAGRFLTGAPRWLDVRPFVSAHHHVETGSNADIGRLFRFVLGGALGLVASGGGAFTAAHIGMHEALVAEGYDFDILGGTSGGAAMMAAVALGVTPAEISRRTHDMFVTRKAMGRWTWPQYSLLDPSVFDEALREHFTDIDIADLPRPFFALATNLTRNEPMIIRRGPLWQAVRASSAIPALLPPIYTADGDMLVDGGLIENVPINAMRRLKTGPTVVLDLDAPPLPRCPQGTTLGLPSRAGLISHALLRRAVPPLPEAPGPQAVLVRALMRENRDIATDLEPGDLLLKFPLPPGASVLDWTRHHELRWAGYDFARAELAERPR
ncbi:MAG: cyclic nucleotide-binding and patatin-like phospholipase domain-containing protein [Hyphomicrobiaceae bacterium]|nr:cyclic nucleotide-binding and patatin-like phospholipase domain-containing protein [Hyphomicrobiaceae bacterium]